MPAIRIRDTDGVLHEHNVYKLHDGAGITWHKPSQTSREGVRVDEPLLPLIESLWLRGLDTDCCCQELDEIGNPGFAQIGFTEIYDAYTFITKSAERLSLDWGRRADRFTLEPAKPLDDGLRGFVLFPASRIPELTEVWF